MIKKLSIIFAFLLLLVSCKSENKELYLLTNSVSIVAFSKIDKVCTIIDYSPLEVSKILAEENLSSQDFFKALYKVDKVKVKQISEVELDRVERLFDSLTFIKEENNGLISYRKLEKDLRKTTFDDTIKPLINDEDGNSFLNLINKKTKIIKLSGDEFISHAAPWEEKIEFFQNWIAQVGVYL